MEPHDNWTARQTSKLISCYKKYPNLWDSRNQYYINRTLRKRCLGRLAHELRDMRPDTTINDIRAKVKTLRTQFLREKKREQDFLQRGVETYEPKLWCYKELKFIDVNDNIQDNNMEYQMLNEALEEILQDKSLDELNTAEKPGRPSRTFSWTREQTCKLLSLLKRRPLLYDSTHPWYAQPIHRKKALRDIHEKLKKCKPGVTVLEMRAKLKTLRSQFLKEKRSSGSKDYIPKLWCYEHMKFLDDRGRFLEEEREESLSALNQDFQDVEEPDDCYVVENENEIFVKSFDESDSEDSEELVPASSPPKISEQKPKSILYQKCLSLVESLSAQTEDDRIIGPVKGKTPASLLGRMVETELSRFPEDIYDDAKWKIINVLEDASKKNKKINSNRF